MKIVISGEMHAGKSTVIDQIRKKYSNCVIGGFLTCPVIENKQKKGYCIESLEGVQEIFAHVDFDEQLTFGPMGVRLDVFKCEYIVLFNAYPAIPHEPDVTIVEQNVLSSAIVVDTVETCQTFIQLKLKALRVILRQVFKKGIYIRN